MTFASTSDATGVSLDFSDPRDDVINDVEGTYYGDVWFAGSSGDDVLVGGRFAVDGYPARFGGLDDMTTSRPTSDVAVRLWQAEGMEET